MLVITFKTSSNLIPIFLQESSSITGQEVVLHLVVLVVTMVIAPARQFDATAILMTSRYALMLDTSMNHRSFHLQLSPQMSQQDLVVLTLPLLFIPLRYANSNNINYRYIPYSIHKPLLCVVL